MAAKQQRSPTIRGRVKSWFNVCVVSFRELPLVPPGIAEDSLALLNTKGVYFGGSEFCGFPQTLGFNHLADAHNPNPH